MLATRRACGSARSRLLTAYVGGLTGYRAFGSTVVVPQAVTATALADGDAPASGKLPDEVGHCTATRIREVAGRREGDTTGSNGTTVTFANGGSQVSHDRDAAAWSARAADPAVMCLILLPRNCPPGGDRGREYLATDRRTRESWVMPDFEHACSGA